MPTYTSRDPKVQALIDDANSLLAKKYYVAPTGENAMAKVRQIEGIDPDNAYARQARARMASDQIGWGQGFIANGEWDAAEAVVKDGLQIQPSNRQLQDMLNYIVKNKAYTPKE
ncbi:hypothetical protein KDL45_16230 [bacterium]|nr:hypothetical protein [bacterium]